MRHLRYFWFVWLMWSVAVVLGAGILTALFTADHEWWFRVAAVTWIAYIFVPTLCVPPWKLKVPD